MPSPIENAYYDIGRLDTLAFPAQAPAGSDLRRGQIAPASGQIRILHRLDFP